MEASSNRLAYPQEGNAKSCSAIDSACGLLSSNNDKSAALVSELESRLNAVLRQSSPAGECASAPKITAESPLHQDLVNKISDVDRLNLRLQDIIGRLTV